MDCPKLCQIVRCRSKVKGLWLGPYGVAYFYNVIIPPPATTLLKLSACCGKNSVKGPADPDTAEHKQWSSGLGNTHGTQRRTTAHTVPHMSFVIAQKLLISPKLFFSVLFIILFYVITSNRGQWCIHVGPFQWFY